MVVYYLGGMFAADAHSLNRAGRPHQKNLAEGEAGRTRGRSAGDVVKSDRCAKIAGGIVNKIRPRRISFCDTPSIRAWIQELAGHVLPKVLRRGTISHRALFVLEQGFATCSLRKIRMD